MAKYVMALDAGTTVTDVFCLTKKVRCAVWHRENSHSISQNRAG